MTANVDLEFKSIVLGEDPAPWSALAALWEESVSRCPFQSPAILRHHSTNTADAKRAFMLYRGGAPIGGVVFKQDASGNLTFLSDLKTDVNRFLFHVRCDQAERKHFFDGLCGAARKENLSLTLNSQPGDHPDTALLQRSAKEAGLYSSEVPNSACPVVEAATPRDLFTHVNGLRELRYRVNKLRNQKDAEFEVFTDAEGLGTWTDEFCDTHVRRWADTPTPSNLRHAHRRAILKGCLTAWAADGVLVRFSIRVAGQRIGFVIGLRARETIIHHSTTYDPQHAKSSPGKALILHMAEWMGRHDYRILDFGDGREDYKYTVATGEKPLVRVFIANKGNIRYIVSSSVIRAVRNNRIMYDVYQRHIKRRLQA
jgi:hypothetical protein